MPRKKKIDSIVQVVSTSQEIAELQLERLKQAARERTLTFEEVRIYDILTKNLMLAKGDPTTISATVVSKEEESIETEDLLKIAQTVDTNNLINVVDEDEGNN